MAFAEKSVAWPPREARGVAAKRRRRRTTTRPSAIFAFSRLFPTANSIVWPALSHGPHQCLWVNRVGHRQVGAAEGQCQRIFIHVQKVFVRRDQQRDVFHSGFREDQSVVVFILRQQPCFQQLLGEPFGDGLVQRRQVEREVRPISRRLRQPLWPEISPARAHRGQQSPIPGRPWVPPARNNSPLGRRCENHGRNPVPWPSRKGDWYQERAASFGCPP